MRTIILAFALCLPGLAGADTIRIASWNIEHLVAEEMRGCRPRTEGEFQRVRDVIEEVGADIWLLQEVESEAALHRIFDPNEHVFHVETRSPRASYPECRNMPGERLAMQATAVVVRDGIAHERLPDLDALDIGGQGRLRHGVTIRLAGEQPLNILNVHLRSGCFEGVGRQACGDVFAQLPVLRAWLDEQDGPALLGGDINRRLEVEGDVFWTLLNEYDDLHIAGAGIRPQCFARFTEFIDFLILDDATITAKRLGSFAETTFSGPEEDFPSDHCPVSIELDLGRL
ncbi:endonuclease/exonuclease/phosphatase family protein [Pararhodobacter sp. SW119]|uniref:endonuclease/exonuclease/phosphatase family protein n=1 Tax=Pararhodobacter sp. SW119 TaxID=2780075 RepID=UPI001AE0E7E9|nr:endonuclease/exonuclease/phosphatase family protein [Pararhodobacter sp. SW119]